MTSWTYFSTTANTTNSYTEQLWAHQFPLLLQKLLCKTSRNKPFRPTLRHYHYGYVTSTIPLPLYTKTRSTPFTNISTDRTLIQFTKEIEENGKIPFLDCLVSRDENKLRTTIYRKPTHTDRLLSQSSYNPTSHKATTIQTLTRRAQLVCDSTDSLTDETNYLNNVFSKNNYNADFVRRNTYKPAEHNATNADPTPVTTATIPYIKGTSETIARILQPYNICVAHKPITTLRQLLTNVKDKDEPNDRQGAVYKIKCCDCQATHIGETGRNLNT